jgi:hypothetical protein
MRTRLRRISIFAILGLVWAIIAVATSASAPQVVVQVKDINPGSTGSSPKFLAALGSDVLFRADDGAKGEE